MTMVLGILIGLSSLLAAVALALWWRFQREDRQ